MEVPYPSAEEQVTLGSATYTHAEIKTVIDSFYTQVGSDDLLSVPFSSVHDWPHHIEHMTHFWWIRFGGTPYFPGMYNPVLKHFKAGFNPTFLARWLGLFQQTLDNHLTVEQAQTWGMLVSRMGQALSAKNEMFKAQYAAHGPSAED